MKGAMKKGEIGLFRSLMILFSLILTGGLCSCPAIPMSGKEAFPTPGVILQKQDRGREIQVRVGEVIEIRLEALGGAGYGWYMEDLDPTLLEWIGEKTHPPREGKIGEPVMEQWYIWTKARGTAEIKMDYYRKWEGQERAVEHFRMKIGIQ